VVQGGSRYRHREDTQIRVPHLGFERFSSALAVGPALWKQLAESYVRDCLARTTSPRVKEMAAYLRLSRDQLSRAFLASTGMALSTFFALVQLEEAKGLLVETDLTVTVLAYRSGFENARTFLRFFKRITGQTPVAYRERARNVTGSAPVSIG
jgi:AraC-like DNA-binding protein